MQVLFVLSLAAVACGSAELMRYPSVYGGISGVYLGSNLGSYITNDGSATFLRYGYPGAIPLVQDVTAEEVAPEPAVTKIEAPAPAVFKAAVPSPITPNTVAPSPIPLNTLAPFPYSLPSFGAYPFTQRGAVPYPLAYGMSSFMPIASQYHAQAPFGQYSFSFAGGPYSRAESRDALGAVRGSYNYLDSEGQVQTQNYVADALGFRVAGTNLPVAPAAPQPSLPEPVQDTPEVAAAKADFEAAFKMAVDADSDESDSD